MSDAKRIKAPLQPPFPSIEHFRYSRAMATQEEFEAALARVKTLSKTPGQGDLLSLYGLYKQASDGDVSGKRPGMMNVKGRAKFDAWSSQKGLSAEEARGKYVALVDSLLAKE